MNDTIAAISTPFGEGALAVIRLTGPRAVAVADAIFLSKKKAAELPARVQQFGKITDGAHTIDDVLLSVHRAPASYTGEDVVEIHCHGGILVTRRVLDAVLAHGARGAEPGEFTQRAFLNGKMDLTQAEAVMDLIRAQTDLALRAATEQLEGRLGEKIRGIREMLLDLLAHTEAFIDFPDEDIDPATGAALLQKLDLAREQIAALLRTADQGKILREGVRTVICGEPNVGKSSLLNVLLGYERAIVSEIPGTTRDTIEEVINLRGIPLRLVDTAGLRESDDAVEREGMARTLKNIERADLVLRVFDASTSEFGIRKAGKQETESEDFLLSCFPHSKILLVLNKADLGEHASWRGVDAVRVSCKTNAGFDALADTIFSRAMRGDVQFADHAIAINARHQACLKSAALFADAARAAIGKKLSAEFIAVELRAALDAVGEVVGKADTEELLGRIFSTFCIGK